MRNTFYEHKKHKYTSVARKNLKSIRYILMVRENTKNEEICGTINITRHKKTDKRME